jgi:hypothetical protein
MAVLMFGLDASHLPLHAVVSFFCVFLLSCCRCQGGFVVASMSSPSSLCETLPRHLVIEEAKLTIGGELAHGSIGLAGVHKGTYNGKPVAIKVCIRCKRFLCHPCCVFNEIFLKHVLSVLTRHERPRSLWHHFWVS